MVKCFSRVFIRGYFFQDIYYSDSFLYKMVIGTHSELLCVYNTANLFYWFVRRSTFSPSLTFVFQTILPSHSSISCTLNECFIFTCSFIFYIGWTLAIVSNQVFEKDFSFLIATSIRFTILVSNLLTKYLECTLYIFYHTPSAHSADKH